jgi:copper chaperone CopZ
MKRSILMICLVVWAALPIIASEPSLVKLNVKGMHCTGCENKVKQALKDIDGVTATQSVSADAGSAVITIDKNVTTEAKVATILAEKTGYVVSIVGDNTTKSCSQSCTKSKSKTKCCSSGQNSPACTPKK